MAGHGASVVLTIDEILATLKHSSLPTVIIEGRDDAIVFRRLEVIYGEAGLSIFAVGGRSALLATFARRDEVGKNDIAFIADRDAWVLCGVPSQCKAGCLIPTEGYSIENDVIRDGRLETLMTAPERATYLRELSEF